VIVFAEAIRDVVEALAFVPDLWYLSAIGVVLVVLATEAGPLRVHKLTFEHYLSRGIVLAALSGFPTLSILALVHQVTPGVVEPALCTVRLPVDELTLEAVPLPVEFAPVRSVKVAIQEGAHVHEREFVRVFVSVQVYELAMPVGDVLDSRALIVTLNWVDLIRVGGRRVLKLEGNDRVARQRLLLLALFLTSLFCYTLFLHVVALSGRLSLRSLHAFLNYHSTAGACRHKQLEGSLNLVGDGADQLCESGASLLTA
jgi:hypothetical protein